MKKVLFLATMSLAGFLCVNASPAPTQQIAAAPAPSIAPSTAPAAAVSKANSSTGIGGAMKVAVPQKDLETAIRVSKEGDILVYAGNDNWYHIDGKALQQGTRVFVLGTGSLVSVFPKDSESDSLR